ncbi:glycerophosphodiester phosphodiesterase [Georgenia ruanii]|uniref:glycerophosphodiester phosphodiesterase n=1 Tax=Georgenia ruanii TaxID=348442 RepID=UPI001D0270AE|nr:glycerophosphodiester phosphodiesterase family protein [Georgenia ruanii]
MTGATTAGVPGAAALPAVPGGPQEAALPLVVAHRGNSSVAPENTLVAFEAAWRAGADLIEVDLQVTRDGVAVVIHNDTVDATTDGAGRVDDLDADELRRLDAGTWFSPRYRGARVPTAVELFAFLAERPDLGLLAEFKGAWQPEAARQVAEEIERAGLHDRVIVQSFWTETVAALRDVAPDLPRGLLLVDLPEDLLALCRELRVMTVNPAGTLLVDEPGLVDALHGEGLRTMPWTLNEPAHWAAAVAAGVDAIITDRPDRLRGWLSAR